MFTSKKLGMDKGSFEILIKWSVNGYVSENGIFGVDRSSDRKLPLEYCKSNECGIWIVTHIESGEKVAYFNTYHSCVLFLDELESQGINTVKKITKNKTKIRNIIIKIKGGSSE